MSVFRFLVVLLAVVVVGLFTVWQHLQAVRTGYNVMRLENLASTLEEDNRQLRMEVLGMKDHIELIGRADRFGLKLEDGGMLKLQDIVPHEYIYENASETLPGEGEEVPGECETAEGTTSP